VLALKLVLVPAFLLLVSLASKRWGPGVAGWLAGLPIVTGPILFFLALERGAEFAAPAAAASLSAVFASVSFSVVYSHACLRLHWAISSAMALCAWLAAAWLLAWLPATAFGSLAVALGTLVAAPRLFPRTALQPQRRAISGAELATRVLAGAALTLFVTAVAAAIGTAWSGLLAVFPILGLVLAVFSHRTQGPTFAVALLRAMPMGLYSFAAFCFTFSVSVAHMGLPVALSAATLISLLVQFATLKHSGMKP
jgi:hypothetical protein